MGAISKISKSVAGNWYTGKWETARNCTRKTNGRQQHNERTKTEQTL